MRGAAASQRRGGAGVAPLKDTDTHNLTTHTPNTTQLFNLPSDTGLILQFAIAQTCNAATSSKSTWNAIDVVLLP